MGAILKPLMKVPARRGWTLQEFECAAAAGVFGPEERLELIAGELIPKRTQNSAHATALRLMEKALSRVFMAGYDVRSQLPLVLEDDKPEPDVAVVRGDARDFAQAHPTGAVLVIEIPNTTLAFDQTTKAALYARAGIAEYWIVNLPSRIVEVHRQPAPMSAQPLGHGYRSLTRHTEEESVAPLAAAQAAIKVADLLP